MARKTLADKKAALAAQAEAIKVQLAELEAKEAERIGRLALRAGLAEIDISDADLLDALRGVVASFRPADTAKSAKRGAAAAAGA